MNKNTLPTLREICDSHTWKRDYEKYLPLSRYVFRPLGFLLAWLTIRIGLTSETVSWLSGFVGLIGCLCLMGSQKLMLPIGITFLLFFNLLDCVDGSTARVMKTENPYGRFLDSLMAWIDMGFWAIIGVMAYRHSELLCWPDPLGKGVIVWLAIGGLACYFSNLIGYVEFIFDELMREKWNKISETPRSDFSENSVTENRNTSLPFIRNIIRRINHNLRVRETHYFFLIFAFLGNAIDILLGFFMFYYALHTLFLIIVYCSRGKQVRSETMH